MMSEKPSTWDEEQEESGKQSRGGEAQQPGF